MIIPVYNKEKYLRQCLDSVLSQDLEAFEIIAVDDGSTDSSGKILDEYTFTDLRLKVIHQKNASCGFARNAGLELAKGEYILFLDSDDFLHKNRLRPAYEFVVSHDADIAVFLIDEYIDTTGISQPLHYASYLNPPEFGRVFSWRDFPDDFFLYFYSGVESKLYRRSLLQNSGIKFRAAKNCEDYEYVFSHLLISEKIIYSDLFLTNYRICIGNSMEDLRENDPCCRITATDKLHDFAAALPFYPQIKKGLARMNAHTHIGFLSSCKTVKAFREYYDTLRNGALEREELVGLPRGYLHSPFADSVIRRILRGRPVMPENAHRSIRFWKGVTFFGGFTRWFFNRLFHSGPTEIQRRLALQTNGSAVPYVHNEKDKVNKTSDYHPDQKQDKVSASKP